MFAELMGQLLGGNYRTPPIAPEQPEQQAGEIGRLQAMLAEVMPQHTGHKSGTRAMDALFNGFNRSKRQDLSGQLAEAVERRQQEDLRKQQEGAIAQAQAKAEAEAKARAQSLEDYESKKQIDQQYAEPDSTTRQRDLQAAGYQPGTPEFQEAMRAQLNKSNAPTVNVNSGGTEYSPMQKELAKGNATDFREWRKNAVAASEVQQQLGALNEIMQAQSTGRVDQAMALAGQYFGTEAGANMQAFNGIASNLVLEAAQKMSGVLSDSDIKLLEATAPQFGNDPRANQVIMKVLGDASQRTIDRYQQAEGYLNQNNSLQGFMPNFSNPSAQPQAAEENNDPLGIL